MFLYGPLNENYSVYEDNEYIVELANYAKFDVACAQ